MKKALVVLTALVLVGCTCIGQIPDQIAYVGADCTVPLDDFTSQVTVSDNCPGLVIQQTPDPGTLLQAGDPVTVVTITATDVSGNQESISFNVVAIDTTPPVITPDASLMTFNAEKAGHLMKASHFYTAHAIQQSIDARPDSALIKYPFLETWDTVYEDYAQVTFYPRNGEGHYLSTWYQPGRYLCSCDSTDYYAQLANGTVINFTFE